MFLLFTNPQREKVDRIDELFCLTTSQSSFRLYLSQYFFRFLFSNIRTASQFDQSVKNDMLTITEGRTR